MRIDLDNLPPHCQMYITHNGHYTNYDTINDYLNEEHIREFISYEDAQECLQSNSIWEVQLYPRTPISFYKTVSSDLNKAIKLMLENFKSGKWE